MTGSNEIDRWVNWRRDIDEIHVYTRTYVLRKYNILRRSLHVTIYSSCWSPIKCHRSWGSSFQLSSVFATMEQEIPPWKNGRRSPIITGSNEIDRWVNWRRDIDEIHVYTRTYVLRKYNILTKSLHVTIYSSCWSQIKCHRSWGSSFQLSSVFATMEQEIPPWKNGRRSPIITGSNEIDRWVNWRRYYSGTTLYDSVLQSTTLYNKVLRQYDSVLQSTTPVRLYYKVVLLYYSVLQSITLYYKVLLCTTKYYASTTPVLLCTARRNKSHRPTSPNTAPATQNECHQWSPSHMKAHFQCVEPVKSPPTSPNTAPATQNECHRWSASHMKAHFQCVGASQVTLQPHQILRLPRKMNVRNDLRHIWNLISNAWSQESHPPTSPNTARATQNQCHQWSASHMKPHFQCVEQVKSPSNLPKYCACHAKSVSSMICVTDETSFPMRGASEVTLQPHQIVRLPRKMNVINDLRHIWNLISNARSKESHPPTSPNTAPATKAWSWRFHRKLPEVLPPIERDDSTISEDNPRISEDIRRYPRIKSSSRTRRFGDLPDPILVTRFYRKIQHFAVLLSPKMSQKCCACHEKSPGSHPPSSANTAANLSLYESITLRI